ncbi:MAG: HAD family hydrolase [Spirochaetia bacterium]|nr:HAD family hydrolase [Spirochaetia bacterium]
MNLLGTEISAVKALIFDMDGTLYENLDYYRFQESSQVDRLAGFLGLSLQEAAERLGAAREARRAQRLPPTSMANHFLSLGVDMPSINRWREETLIPGEWLQPDPRLDKALESLATRFRLVLLTNNPRSVGRASLEALGVASRFEQVTGLDDTEKSKPSIEPFIAACRGLRLPFSACVSIGDRKEVDIEPALELGMGGILVRGVKEVYELPALFGLSA